MVQAEYVGWLATAGMTGEHETPGQRSSAVSDSSPAGDSTHTGQGRGVGLEVWPGEVGVGGYLDLKPGRSIHC